MQIDHIFIFSDNVGEEADALADFGLTEGSSRVHPGQGTVNRKFYFQNFFLEILWVNNEEEVRSKQTSITKLWERSQFATSGYSRFGLCLVNTEDTDILFAHNTKYQPAYFPEGMAIDIITHEENPALPMTFRLPYRGGKEPVDEPTNHRVGTKQLTHAIFGVPELKANNSFTHFFENTEAIAFEPSDKPTLTLEFNQNTSGRTQEFSALNLIVKY